ncbi:MAG TPA: MFS transporter [Longilinea sp.]|nr:MFS transporter [Longilinea sp.]
MDKDFRLYGYRWVVLAVFMFVNLAIQILWISYAPINGQAAAFYGVTDQQIGFLAMSFMITFIPLSIPVSWAIDTYGFRPTVSIGVILMAIFAILRGLAGSDYTLVLLSTIGLAVAQPFLMNAWTKMPALWFGIKERATAVGLVTLSSLAGIAVGMAVTPLLAASLPIPTVQLIYGGVAAFSALLFLILARETPPTPPGIPGEGDRALMLDGLKHALKEKNLWLYLSIYFIGMGLFNGITTWVETIVRPRGFSAIAGDLGALMLVGGVLGALVLPALSDKQQNRKRYLMIGFLAAIPGLIGLTFTTAGWLLYVSAFFLGFFLTGAGPVGMQYAAEIAYPTPEGTSNGIIQLFGQVSVVFVYLMEALRSPDGSFTNSLMLGVGLLLLSGFIITRMKEPAKRH